MENDCPLQQYGKKREGASGFTYDFSNLQPFCLSTVMSLPPSESILQTSRSDALVRVICKSGVKVTKH